MLQDVLLIWGNSSPSTPYTVNAKGQGPAWSNSLFEDNAEFGYGMLLGQKAIRKRLKAEVETIAASDKASARSKSSLSGISTHLTVEHLMVTLQINLLQH